MHRCLELARLGAGHVAPNPLVGSVLVHNGRIIGEGYHRQYGQAHAEVNCIRSVRAEDRALITESTLYVSLEPCAHFGKTPPCADLILTQGIPRVVVGCTDPFKEVAGKGIAKLQAAGVEVLQGVEETACLELNRRFFTFHRQQRPYIILKWAQTANGVLGYGAHAPGNSRLHITNGLTNRLVHKWRSEEAGILVGTNTALLDDPALTNRYWPGPQPVRLVLDRQLRLPGHLQLMDGSVKTIVFNGIRNEAQGNLVYYKTDPDLPVAAAIAAAAHQLQLQSLLVEGGTQLMDTFIAEGLWDEARVITNTTLFAKGVAAPQLPAAQHTGSETVLTDRVDYFYNAHNS